MKNITEAVDLPDPAVQELVHPLDVPQAKATFATAWWLSVLTLPTVFFGIAGILWGLSNNYVTPILVPAIVAVAAVFSRKHYLSEAWAYIPRKRQDTERSVPTLWSVLKSALAAVVFLLGLIVLIQWFVAVQLPADVLAYAAGMSAAVVVIMAVNFVWTIVTPKRLSASLGGWAPQLVSMLVVIVALAFGFQAVNAAGTTASWQAADLVIGGSILLGVQVLLWLSKLVPSRQRSRSDA